MGAFFYLNSTNQLNNTARNVLNKYVAGCMYFEDLHLDFNRFPVIKVNASNGYLISALNKYPTDTLCRFKHLDVDIDVMRLLDDSLTIAIPKVTVTDGFALVTISKDGVPGWNVWRFKKPRPKGRKPKHRERLYIDEVHLRGSNRFRYYNAKRKRSMDIKAGNLDLKGSIRIKYREIYVSRFSTDNVNALISLKGGASNIYFSSPKVTLTSVIERDVRMYTLKLVANNTSLKLFGNTFFHGSDQLNLNAIAGFNIRDGKYVARNIDILVNDVSRLNIAGLYNTHTCSIATNIGIATADIMTTLRDFRFDTLSVLKNRKLTLPMQINAKAQGILNFKTHTYPIISMSVKSSDGCFDAGKHGVLKNINLLANTQLDLIYPDSAILNITQLGMNYKDSYISIGGKVSGGIKTPQADLDIGGNLNLADFSSYLYSGLNMRGNMKARAHVNIPFTSLKITEDATIKLLDTIRVSNFSFKIPHTVASVASKSVGLMLNDIIGTKKATAYIMLNDIKLNSIDEMDIYIDKICGEAKILNDHSMFFPQLDDGRLMINNSRTITAKGDTLTLSRFTADFLAQCMNGNDPMVKYFAILENMSCMSPDSTCIYVRDLVMMAKAAMYKSADFRNDNLKLLDVIGNWEYRGELILNNSQFLMQKLPLLSSIQQLDVSFSEYDARLNKLSLKVGDTNLNVSGNVSNWHKYIFKDSLLRVNANVEATAVNLNQLIPAIIKGAAYAQNSDQPKRKSKNFVEVPSNIDANLFVKARNARYGIGRLDSVMARISIKNRHLDVRDLEFRSNIANFNMQFSYATPYSNYADASLDFDMKNLNAEQVIEMIPQSTIAVPMLKTFEGKFDTQIGATWIIDSTMSINRESVISNIAVDGLKLSIEKRKVLPKFLGWLLFGNQHRLAIDSIGIRLAINGKDLALSPMNFNIGKYTVGASGVLYNNYMYCHVAVLKSPLRLKFGLDIYGVPKKMRFRLSSVKGKNLDEMRAKLNISESVDFIPQKFRPEITKNVAIMDSNYPTIYKDMRYLIQNRAIPVSKEYIDSVKNLMIERIPKIPNIKYK